MLIRKILILILFAPSLALAELPIVPAPDAYGLDQIEDVTPLQHQDTKAYYGLLHHANSVSQAELRKAGREFIQQRMKISKEATFPDMLHHPEAFRGQPVRLEGHLLQSVEFNAEANEWGIKRLYEAALFTDDSVHHPLTVVFLEKPPELEIGSELVGNVAVSGYFLKMYTYPSNDNKTRKAPLILAKTITVFPDPKPQPIIGFPIAFGSIASVIVIVVIAVWVGYYRDRKRLLQRRAKELDEQRPDFNDFK